MRPLALTLSLSALLAASPARAADEPADGSGGPAAVAVASPVERAPWYALSDVTHLGLQIDAGAPGLGGATVLFRPWWWVRFNAGLAYDYVGYGVRGGVSFVPWHWAITPSLNLDYGHYLSGDATRFSSSAGPAERELLRNATYDFATAQIGLELGSQRWFSFYLRGGFAYVTASAKGSQLSAFANERSNDPSLQFTLADATARALIPCASLGFLFYVY